MQLVLDESAGWPCRPEEKILTSLVTLIGNLSGTDSLPLYQQLQRGLRQAIQNKLLAPEDALPPEREMAEEFSVSRITVRKALDGLVGEGLLTRRQGSGHVRVEPRRKELFEAHLVF